MQEEYPLTYSVDYPEAPLNRLTTFFRIFTVIPIAILMATITGFSTGGGNANDTASVVVIGVGILWIPVVLMLLFRQKYPRWWFDWNREFFRFGSRIGIYMALLTDRYPSTDEQQSLHIDFEHPDAERLNRWLPLVKWFLAIPHYIVLFFLWIAAIVCVIIAWFAILFTGNYPRGLFDFVVGVGRWHARVMAYAYVLITDRYPPFSLDPVGGSAPPAPPAPSTPTA